MPVISACEMVSSGSRKYCASRGTTRAVCRSTRQWSFWGASMSAAYARTIRTGVMSTLMIASISPAIATPASDMPAVWFSHAIIVDLDNLPKRYTCDELWYRFRAVLLSIGARPDLQITPYHCDERSPSVELQFSLPHAIESGQRQLADLRAADNSITLEPGQPTPLDSADCELMRQVKDELFPELPVHIVSFHLSCAAPQTAHHHFKLTLQALTPQPQTGAKGAASSQANSGVNMTTAAIKKHG